MWAFHCSRPGRKAFAVEWLAAALGLSAQTFWSVNVLWLTLLAVAIVPAAYMALAGVVLRRLAERLPLCVAAPVAWIGLETLSGVVEPPLGFGWMRFGHHAHDHAFLLGAMRVVGVGGVGFALASVAGLAADALRARRTGTRLGPRPVAFTAAALLAVALASLATAPPATVPGPRVLMVQPAFEAKRKQRPPSARELFEETIALTRRGLLAAEEAGRPVDLVTWGETVFPWPVAEPTLGAAYDRGARAAPWGQWQLGREDIDVLHRIEREQIGARLLGASNPRRVIPAGTLFATGAEEYVERDGRLRRANSIVVFGEDGARVGRGGKIHLVPGGETVAGLERIDWIRETAFDLAGYVPDLVADDRTSVVELPLRDGRKVHVGLTVCFDNTYDGPYTDPARRGHLDFHLITSNEAWYVESWEFDQMVAFSRCIAAATGRSMVRATNSGITVVIGPDGRDLARLRGPGGKDRNEPGFLIAEVPVPATALGPTPYARVEPYLRGLWVVLPWGLLLAFRRRRPELPSPARGGGYPTPAAR